MSLITTNNPFGLDIGDEVLRLIQLKQKRRRNVIISANELHLPQGVIAEGEIKDPNQLIKLIRQLVATAKGKKINTRQVISVLPEKKTFIKLIKVKPSPEETTGDLLIKEIPKHIPLDVSEINFDWQIINDRILIGAAPKIIIENYLNILKKSYLTPLVLEIEAAAITRCLLNNEEVEPKIIIDMGAVRTGLILYGNKTIQFSVSLPLSGNQITKKIAETLKLDFKKAEMAKITCGLDDKKCDGVIKKILMSAVNDLIRKVEEAVTFYQDHFQAKGPIKEIILCGGGANLINVDKIIAEKMKTPVVLGNPLTKIHSLDKSIIISPAKLQSYATAIGLALRAFENNQII